MTHLIPEFDAMRRRYPAGAESSLVLPCLHRIQQDRGFINGRFYCFRARAVVIAVGNGGWKVSYHHNTCAGDNVDLGLRAGAEVTNAEFARVWLTPRYFAWEGQTYLLPLGARLVNAKGESFMDKYSPVLGANTDPHYVARAMAIEALQGNSPFYMDLTAMTPEGVEMMTPKGRVDEIELFKTERPWVRLFQRQERVDDPAPI